MVLWGAMEQMHDPARKVMEADAIFDRALKDLACVDIPSGVSRVVVAREGWQNRRVAIEYPLPICVDQTRTKQSGEAR